MSSQRMTMDTEVDNADGAKEEGEQCEDPEQQSDDAPPADEESGDSSSKNDASNNKGEDLKDRSGSERRNRKKYALALVLVPLVMIGLIVGLTVGLQNSSDAKSSQSGTQQQDTRNIIPPDPRVKYGTLPNGVKYMVMSNGELPDRLSVRLHVDAGSLHEDEDQRGMAHFLEHMLFEGTRNFPEPPELIREMQRMGISFGAHANAYTSFDETVYMIDLPDVTNETLTTGFAMMRDFADGALLDPDEIEKERGVILSEDREYDSVEWRFFLKQMELLLPDHRLTYRFPIGDKDVIRTVPKSRFLDFYTQYYVPERITVVAVGDVDTDALQDYIEDAFESMVQPEEAGADPEMGNIPAGTGFQSSVFIDEEVINDEIWLSAVRPWMERSDTVEWRIKKLPIELAHNIIDERLDKISKEEGSPIRGGYAYKDNWFHLVDWGSFIVAPLEGRWEDAVAVLEQELRRAKDYGFTRAELEEVKSFYLEHYESAVMMTDTRESWDLVDELVDSINGRYVFSTTEEDLRIAKVALEAATLDVVNKAFTDYWDTEDLALFLTIKEEQERATPEVLQQLYVDSKKVMVAPPPKDDADVAFGYTSSFFGPPGTIVSNSMIEDLDIRQMVLSNNVRVNMKNTNFDQNYVGITARFGTGKLNQPKRAWLDAFAETVFDYGGLGKHSQDEIDTLFADNSVWNGFWCNNDDFEFSTEIISDDLELQLQLMAATFSDPGYREEAVRQFRGDVPSIMTYLSRTLEGAIEHVDEFVWGNDERFAVPTKEGLLSFQASDVKDWVHSELTSGYLELSLVGDFDMDSAISFILGTFGSLPERQYLPTEVESDARAIAFPPTPDYRTFTYKSKIGRASAIVVFQIPPIKEDIKEHRRIDVLSEIFNNRLRDKIREELGESYSPYAYADGSSSFSTAYIWAESEGEPSVTERTSQLIIDVAKNISDTVTEDELLRVKNPILTLLDEDLRDNDYWLYKVMWESQQKPWKLDWRRERVADYESITLQEMKTLAAIYLTPENSLRIDVLPKDVDNVDEDEEDTSRSIRYLLSQSKIFKGHDGTMMPSRRGGHFTNKKKPHDRLSRA